MQRSLVLVLSVMAVARLAVAQRKQEFQAKETVGLAVQLFKAIAPALPQNSYMTKFMKEKLGGIFAGIEIRQLSVVLWDNRDGTMGSQDLLMASGYDNGVPVIRVSVSRLYEIVRIQQHVATGFSQSQKNGFALALTRATVHLEHPASFFAKSHGEDEIIREELRVYRMVDQLAVVPLLKIGQPMGLDVDYKALHGIIAKCGDSEDCPAFQKYYKGKKVYPPKLK